MEQPSLLVSCVQCGALVAPSRRGRKRRYCSTRCAREEWRERASAGQYGTCAEPECDKGVRAKGLCSTHYNRAHQPERHRKVTVPCDWCARPCTKDATRGRRYRALFCSDRCRDDWRAEEQAWTFPIGWRRCPGPGCGLLWFKRGSTAKHCQDCIDAKNFQPVEIDPRGPLLRALDEGDGSGVIDAIRAGCDVKTNGCWEWTRRVKDGYAVVFVRDRVHQVHRLTLQAKLGRPLGEQAAHHVCANSRCVNPEHLQPVTAAANMAEMLARRYLVGRIQQLEAALTAIAPDHPALAEVSVSQMSEVA